MGDPRRRTSQSLYRQGLVFTPAPEYYRFFMTSLNPFIGRAWFSHLGRKTFTLTQCLVSIPLSAGLGFHKQKALTTNKPAKGLNPFIGRAWFSRVAEPAGDGGRSWSQSLYRQGLVFTEEVVNLKDLFYGLNPFIGRAWFSLQRTLVCYPPEMSQSLYRQGLVFTRAA